MMDKSRAPENNTTPVFKDRGSQKQQHEQKKKKASSDQTDNCCQQSLVCQYSQMQDYVELNLTENLGISSRFKWYHQRHAQILFFFFFTASSTWERR